MSRLIDTIRDRLVGARWNSDGSLTSQCPACAHEGHDLKGRNHLRVYPNGAFNCIVHSGDKDHNRIIRALIRGNEDGSSALNTDVEYIDPDPRLDIDKVYPEDMVSRLVRDHTYWIDRRIGEPVLVKLGGGLAPTDEASKLSGRYVFPIRNDAKQIIGWSGRLTTHNSFAPNWKHLFKSGRTCWPWYLNGEAIRTARAAVLLESIGDALTLATHDIWNWVVVFGCNLNSQVISHLVAANPRRIIISTNNDLLGEAKSKAAGNKAADRFRAKLLSFFNEGTIQIRLPQTAKDWNAADSAEVEQFRREIAS